MSNITINDLKKIGWVTHEICGFAYILRYGNTNWYLDYSHKLEVVLLIYQEIGDENNYIFEFEETPITFDELIKLMDNNYIV